MNHMTPEFYDRLAQVVLRDSHGYIVEKPTTSIPASSLTAYRAFNFHQQQEDFNWLLNEINDNFSHAEVIATLNTAIEKARRAK